MSEFHETVHLSVECDETHQLYKQSPLGWIPNEWGVEKCDSLCREILVGIVIQPTQYYTSSGVPVLRSANVREDGINGDDLVFMSEDSNRQLAKSMVRCGDVVTVRTGYPGTSAVITGEFDGANCVDIIISRPASRIHSEFLSLWINSDLGKTQVLRTQGGLAQQHFNVGELKRLLVAVPPLPLQRKIARILTTVDNLIEQTEALIEKYKSIKQGMMHDLFTRGVDSTGSLRPPYEDAPRLYKQSPLGWIPKEWDVHKCISLCREIVVGIVIQPTQYYTSWGVPVLRSANVREDGVNGDDLVFMSEASNTLLSQSMVRRGDVVTVRTGYPGTSSVITDEFDGANCVDIIISRPTSWIRSEYLVFWINSNFGKSQVLRKQGGLAQQHFNVGELKSLLVAVSPLPEQVRIEEILLNLRQREATEREALDKARRYKAGLMQDLLTGKVRVNVDEAEEVTADV